jgi:hypothetical protein
MLATVAEATAPKGVHLVGSVPLESAEDVFRILAPSLGDRLSRLPDGETGDRSLFAGWQVATFKRHPDFEPVKGRRLLEVVKPHRIRSGVDPRSIRFSDLGFAGAAESSYQVFRRLRSEGVIPARMRFQVSLPTPVNCLAMVVAKEDVPAIDAAYEAAVLDEVDAIVASIPASDLAIQWDTPWEVRVWDGNLPAFLVQPWFTPARDGVIDRLARLGSRVPEPVQLGYHLCHGDYEHTGNLILGLKAGTRGRLTRSIGARVLREVSIRIAGPPKDARSVTEMANALVGRGSRPIDFLHLPFPRAAERRYFAPLADLRLPPGVEVYLGLVHYTDGVDGTRRRIAAAREALNDFGVATECGWGRRDPATTSALIGIHRQVSEPI